jgi:ABC-type uncharacterized transport system auxiliary subunit
MIAGNTNPVKRLSGTALCLATVFFLAAAGCNSRAYNKKYFILDVTRPSTPASKPVTAALEVRRFTIDRAFDSKSLVYRVDEYRYKSAFYNEFLISPEEMITDKTRDWLSDSGLFERVTGLGSGMRPRWMLQGNITALYGDSRDQSALKAVMRIRIFLIENTRENRIVFGKDYRENIEVKSPGPESLMAAYSEGLEKILTELENEIEKKIGESD